METKKINIDGYGEVEIKKYNYLERCNLKGKIVKVSIDKAGREKEEVDTSALFFWSVVYSIKSLPNYPNFHSLPEDKKIDVVTHLGDLENEPDNLGEMIYKEASEFNQLNPKEIKKKSD